MKPLRLTRKQWQRQAEDLLKHLYFRETEHTGFGLEAIPAQLEKNRDRLADILIRHGWVRRKNGELILTPSGKRRAENLIRRHRIFETWLAERTGHAPGRWHQLAEGKEHELTDEQIREWEYRLGFPLLDPHGDPIPSADGTWVKQSSLPLSGMQAGDVALILHLEDEPRDLMDRILDLGLYPGGLLKILERSREGIFAAFEGRRIFVPQKVARHIAATQVDASRWNDKCFRLTYLPREATARIVRLTDDLRGLPRQRLLDLGFVPGARVRVYLISPLGEPVAYDVKNASIALRKEQSDKILVELCRD